MVLGTLAVLRRGTDVPRLLSGRVRHAPLLLAEGSEPVDLYSYGIHSYGRHSYGRI